LSAKNKKKEDLKEFKVGSQPPPSGPTKAKKVTKNRLEISENDFPVLASLLKSKDLKPFQDELKRILGALQEVSQKGSGEDQKQAQTAEKAYALSIALLDNSKLVP
jgi:hypothetical protein